MIRNKYFLFLLVILNSCSLQGKLDNHGTLNTGNIEKNFQVQKEDSSFIYEKGVLKIIPEIKKFKQEDIKLSIRLEQKKDFYEINNGLSEYYDTEKILNDNLKEDKNINLSYNISYNENKENKKNEKLEFSAYTTGGNENLKINGENIKIIKNDIDSPGSYISELKSKENFFKFTGVLTNSKDLGLFFDWKDYSWTEKQSPKKVVIYFDEIGKYIKIFNFDLIDKKMIDEIYYITKTGEKKYFFFENIGLCEDNCFYFSKNKSNEFLNLGISMKKNLENISKIEILFSE